MSISRLIALAGLLMATAGVSAQILTFDHGKVEFHTSSIMSDIEAVSEDISVSLDLQSGAVKIGMSISSFEFEYEMMQEHFNEEYLESHIYPDATFTGKVIQDITNITQAVEVDVSGTLTIHGVTKPANFKATLSKVDGFTKVKCMFPIVFKDFGVDEPSILTKSVAKDVEVKGLLYLK